MPPRPLRPPGWKEAHRVRLVQPCSREAQVGSVHLRVTSILADVRRTYVELRWKSPIIGARFFAERAELYDPFGKLIARRADLDAGDRAERFLGFGPVPTAATQAVLHLYPADGGEAVVMPLHLEPRVRGRGAFSVPVGTSVMLAGRRLEVVSYHGGVTEAVVEVRLTYAAPEEAGDPRRAVGPAATTGEAPLTYAAPEEAGDPRRAVGPAATTGVAPLTYAAPEEAGDPRRAVGPAATTGEAPRTAATAWPITLDAALAKQPLHAEARTDAHGRAQFDIEIEAPPAIASSLLVNGLSGLPLAAPLQVELGAGEQKRSVRVEGGTVRLETLPRDSGDGTHALRLRMPHATLSENVALTEFTRHALRDAEGAPIEVVSIETTRWPTAIEQEIVYRGQSAASVLVLDGMTWRFEPAPQIRLGQA